MGSRQREKFDINEKVINIVKNFHVKFKENAETHST